MDFKGLAWADNVYEKFEAMCLEVEEVMRQDTVKYVENQVQKVGINVKKLYSEIMQDLLPLSGVDPVKVAAGDVSLSPCAHLDMNEKPKAMLENSDLKKESTEDKLNADEDVGKKLSLSGLGDKRGTSLLCNLRESCVPPSDQTNVMLSTDLVGSCNSVDAVITNDSIIKAPGESSTSNVTLSVDCARQDAEVSCYTSFSHPRPSESISIYLWLTTSILYNNLFFSYIPGCGW